MNDFSQSMLQAFRIVADSAIEESESTTTIEVEIVEAVSSTEYKVKYMGNVITAIAEGTTTYEEKDICYAIVPNNDFTQNVLLIGRINQSSTASSGTIISYKDMTSNLLDLDEDTFEIQSWFDVNSNGSGTYYQNEFFSDAIEKVFQMYDGLLLSYNIQTISDSLTTHSIAGDYGVILNIPISYDGGDTVEWYQFKLTRSVLTGRVDYYSVTTTQKLFCQLPSKAIFINNSSMYPIFLSIFGEYSDYNNTDETVDITISDLEICGVVDNSDIDLTEGYIDITCSNGFFFSSEKTELSNDKLLVPVFYQDSTVQDLSYNYGIYWFKQNNLIDSTSLSGYSSLMGDGWELLQSIPITINTSSSSYGLTVSQDDILYQANYICLIIDSDGLQYTQRCELYNLDNELNFKVTPVSTSNIYPRTGIIQFQVSIESSVLLNPIFSFQLYDNVVNLLYEDDDTTYDGQNFFEWVENLSITENEGSYSYTGIIGLKGQYITRDTLYFYTGLVAYLENDLTSLIDFGSYLNVFLISGELSYTVTENNNKIYKFDKFGNSPFLAHYDGTNTQQKENNSYDTVSISIFDQNGEEIDEILYQSLTYTWTINEDSLIRPLDGTTFEDTSTTNSFNYTLTNIYIPGKDDNNFITCSFYLNSQQYSIQIPITIIKESGSTNNGILYDSFLGTRMYNGTTATLSSNTPPTVSDEYGYNQIEDEIPYQLNFGRGNSLPVSMYFGDQQYCASTLNSEECHIPILTPHLYKEGEEISPSKYTAYYTIYSNDFLNKSVIGNDIQFFVGLKQLSDFNFTNTSTTAYVYSANELKNSLFIIPNLYQDRANNIYYKYEDVEADTGSYSYISSEINETALTYTYQDSSKDNLTINYRSMDLYSPSSTVTSVSVLGGFQTPPVAEEGSLLIECRIIFNDGSGPTNVETYSYYPIPLIYSTRYNHIKGQSISILIDNDYVPCMSTSAFDFLTNDYKLINTGYGSTYENRSALSLNLPFFNPPMMQGGYNEVLYNVSGDKPVYNNAVPFSIDYLDDDGGFGSSFVDYSTNKITYIEEAVLETKNSTAGIEIVPSYKYSDAQRLGGQYCFFVSPTTESDDIYTQFLLGQYQNILEDFEDEILSLSKDYLEYKISNFELFKNTTYSYRDLTKLDTTANPVSDKEIWNLVLGLATTTSNTYDPIMPINYIDGLLADNTELSSDIVSYMIDYLPCTQLALTVIAVFPSMYSYTFESLNSNNTTATIIQDPSYPISSTACYSTDSTDDYDVPSYSGLRGFALMLYKMGGFEEDTACAYVPHATNEDEYLKLSLDDGANYSNNFYSNSTATYDGYTKFYYKPLPQLQQLHQQIIYFISTLKTLDSTSDFWVFLKILRKWFVSYNQNFESLYKELSLVIEDRKTIQKTTYHNLKNRFYQYLYNLQPYYADALGTTTSQSDYTALGYSFVSLNIPYSLKIDRNYTANISGWNGGIIPVLDSNFSTAVASTATDEEYNYYLSNVIWGTGELNMSSYSAYGLYFGDIIKTYDYNYSTAATNSEASGTTSSLALWDSTWAPASTCSGIFGFNQDSNLILSITPEDQTLQIGANKMTERDTAIPGIRFIGENPVIGIGTTCHLMYNANAYSSSGLYSGGQIGTECYSSLDSTPTLFTRVYSYVTTTLISGAYYPFTYLNGYLSVSNKIIAPNFYSSTLIEGNTIQGVVAIATSYVSSPQYITSSDKRIKENIQEVNNKLLDVFDSITPVQFTLKNKGDKYHLGYIAQSVEEEIQRANLEEEYNIINIQEKYIDEEQTEYEDFYGLDYNQLSVLTAVAVKEEKKKRVALEEKVSKLEDKISSLDEKIATQQTLIEELIEQINKMKGE